MPDGSPAAAAVPSFSELRRARTAVSAVFFLSGFLFASWVPRIPEKRDALGIGEGALGLALLAMAIGALLAMRATGRLIDRVGARRPIGTAAALYAATFATLAFADTLPLLALALFAYGAAAGALDVAMNVEGAAVERDVGRPIFSAFHGMFSLGGMVGAAGAGLAAEAGLPLAAHFAPLALAAALVGAAAMAALPETRPAPETEAAPVEEANARLRLRLLGLIAFCALLAEGAAADWSAILLVDHKDAGAWEAGAAFAAFSATMALGRFAGDAAQRRMGRPAIVRGGGALAAAGYALAVAAPTPALAVAGFAAAGVGISCLFPATLSAGVAAAGPRAAGAAVAAISTMGYFGLLIGPPLIGFLAEAIGLPLALAGVGLLLLTPVAAARFAGRG